MTVESYLELFTTLFGWQQYNNLWSILSDTGVVYLPFLFILARNFLDPAANMEPQDAGAFSVRRMEIDVALALLVVVLAAQPAPLTTLHPAVLRYEQPCPGTGPLPATATPGASGTTYDRTFASILTATEVPIWWYGVMALSGGTTHAAIRGIGCVRDLSGYRLEIGKIRIKEPRLLGELGRFLQDCLIPARSKYYREQPDVSALLSTHGERDPEWFGSRVYRAMPGYYERFRARAPVAGWPFAPGRDTEYDPPAFVPAHGRPYCKEWYEHPVIGLRAKLLAAVPADLRHRGTGILATVGFTSYTQAQWEDDTIRALVTTTLAAAPARSDLATVYNDEGILGGSGLVNLPLIGAGLGTAWEQLSFSPMLYAVRAGAPVVQSLILLAIYMLLPFALVFSGYAWSMVVTGSIAVFAVKFWSYLWHVAKWLEDNLMRALYPDGSSFFGASLANLTDGDFALKVLLIEVATGLLFVGLPIVFLMIVAWGGYRAIGALSSLSQTFRNPMEAGGRSGGELAKKQLGRRLGL